jgi:hypothetical protein
LRDRDRHNRIRQPVRGSAQEREIRMLADIIHMLADIILNGVLLQC